MAVNLIHSCFTDCNINRTLSPVCLNAYSAPAAESLDPSRLLDATAYWSATDETALIRLVLT